MFMRSSTPLLLLLLPVLLCAHPHPHRPRLCASPSGPHPCDCLHHVPSGSRIEVNEGFNRIHLPNGTIVRHNKCTEAIPKKPRPRSSRASTTSYAAGTTSASPASATTATPRLRRRAAGKDVCLDVTAGTVYHGRPFNAEYLPTTTKIGGWSATYTVPSSPSAPGATSGTDADFLFYWIGLQDTTDPTTPVIQPVLSYSATGAPNADIPGGDQNPHVFNYPQHGGGGRGGSEDVERTGTGTGLSPAATPAAAAAAATTDSDDAATTATAAATTAATAAATAAATSAADASAASLFPFSGTANSSTAAASPIWYGMSWNCCPSGHKYSASSVSVAGPGDLVKGTITCPDSTTANATNTTSTTSTTNTTSTPAAEVEARTRGDTCTVSTQNVAGDTSILTLDDQTAGAPTWDWAIVELETYGTTGCGSYASDTAAFTDMKMTSSTGSNMEPGLAEWSNDPWLQIKASASEETKATAAYSACCGGSFQLGPWPTMTMTQNGGARDTDPIDAHAGMGADTDRESGASTPVVAVAA